MTIAIPATLANAVVFDLDGNFAGLVIPCGDKRIVTTPEGLRQASREDNSRSADGVLRVEVLRLRAAQPKYRRSERIRASPKPD